MKVLRIILMLMIASFTLNHFGLVQAKRFGIDYNSYEKVLERHVKSNGKVDYSSLKKNSRKLLNAFVDDVETTLLSELTPDEEKAFWINAYNAIILKEVVDHYPITSIKEIKYGLMWSVNHEMARLRISLNDVKHKMLRPLGDPRIHFALNSASVSCPALLNSPFKAEILDQQLEEAAKKFIRDPAKVRLDREKKILYYSAIFGLYQEDFLLVSSSILEYIKKYLNQDDIHFIDENEVVLKRMDYGWRINDQSK